MFASLQSVDATDARADAVTRFEEAPAWQHRRRRALMAASIVVMGAGSYVVARSGAGSSPGPRPPATASSHAAPGHPVVNAAALRGHGSLAFISDGGLWLLDGATGSLRPLPTGGGTPQHPAFSADGRWLSYTATSGPHGDQLREWVARADGSDAGSVRLHGGTSVIGWGPHGHLLAEARFVGHSLFALSLLNPLGTRSTLGTVRGFWDATWAPDGRSLAVTTNGGVTGTTKLLTYPVDGRPPVTWLARRFHHDPLNGMQQPLLDLAGWWPHQGIGVWVIGDGAVSTNDQAPLDLIRSPSARPRLLGRTLLGVDSTAVTASRSGWLALVNNSPRAFGRLIWQGKHILVCAPERGSCEQPTTARASVSLDPSWSPNGHTLAFVDAPASDSPGFPQHTVARWYAAHDLELYDATRHTLRTLPAANGASAPQWSPDGGSLLYTARDGIWLLASLTGTPVRIATPLLPRHAWGAYYGQVDWSGQFAWDPRTPTAAAPPPAPAR
ncbi:MAG TPA: hypothetical protein VHC43_07665 [Mycobacteriales bacterium]|nr:hypothetical protein [Mycobacteriales bacterium]